jgi:hypothetical protein
MVLSQRAKETWARKRPGRSMAHVDDTMNGDGVGDALMQKYLAKKHRSTAKVPEARPLTEAPPVGLSPRLALSTLYVRPSYWFGGRAGRKVYC